MAYRIRLLELAAGGHHDLEGQYLVKYDPGWHLPSGNYDGGDLVTSPHEHMAQVFDTPGEAMEVWRTGPDCRCHRTRPDGRPNRPLTAFNVEILEV